jgi:hypothetical protein
MYFRNKVSQKFEILSEFMNEYMCFNTVGKQLTVRLSPPSETDTNTVSHFLASVNDLYEHALQNARDCDMVGLAIHNEVNQNDKPIRISIRRRGHLCGRDLECF